MEKATGDGWKSNNDTNFSTKARFDANFVHLFVHCIRQDLNLISSGSKIREDLAAIEICSCIIFIDILHLNENLI